MDWPELKEFLLAVNAAKSPIESIGCEKGYFPTDLPGLPAKARVGSYINLIFTNATLNDRPENALLLASHVLGAVKGCTQRWSDVEIGLERRAFPPIQRRALDGWGTRVRGDRNILICYCAGVGLRRRKRAALL